MASLKYITGPDGEEYVEVDFTADMSTTGWKYSPWFYHPAGHYVSVQYSADALTGTNQWALMGTADPSDTGLAGSGHGVQISATATLNYSSAAYGAVFDPTTFNNPTSWYPGHPYISIAVNNGSTSNAGDTVLFVVRFFKKTD